MAYITKYGSLFGTVPPTTGQVFFVAPAASYTVDGRTYSASDNNDGLSPERALRTIARFVTLATVDAGDTALLIEGTHTLTSVANINKSGLTLLGYSGQYGAANRLRKKTIVSAEGEANHIFNVGASDVEIGYLEFRTDPGYSGLTFVGGTDGAGFDSLYVHDCTFRQRIGANSGGAMIDFANRPSAGTLTVSNSDAKQGSSAVLQTAYIENCHFEASGAQQPAIEVATARVHIKNCSFSHGAGQQDTSAAWNTAVYVGTNASGCVMEDSVFSTSNRVVTWVDGTNANADHGFAMLRCYFKGRMTDMSKPIDNFAATTNWLGECVMVQCYVLTASGGGTDSAAPSGGAASNVASGFRGVTLIT